MNKQLKIKDIIELWKKVKVQYVKRSTYVTYVVLLNKHIVPFFGEKEEINNIDMQNFILIKLDEKLSMKSIKDIITVLKMVMKFGVKSKLIEYQEIEVMFPTSRVKKDLDVLSISNQKKLIKYIENNLTFKSLGIYICLCTGLRIGEICALKWRDIDIERGVVKVNKTIQRIYKTDGTATELLIDCPKTVNSYREVPLVYNLLKILKSLVKVMNLDYFIISNNILPLEPRTYRNYYNKLLKQLDIPFITFHGLRHSFATRCVESNCDYKTISVLLGHSSISTTMNLYVHPNMEQKKKCISKMARLLK